MKENLKKLMLEYNLQYGLIFDFEKNATVTIGETSNIPSNALITTWLENIQKSKNVYDNYSEGTVILPTIMAQDNVRLIIHIPKENILTGFLTNSWTFQDVLTSRKRLGEELDKLFAQ